jgi:hypothetical protein
MPIDWTTERTPITVLLTSASMRNGSVDSHRFMTIAPMVAVMLAAVVDAFQLALAVCAPGRKRLGVVSTGASSQGLDRQPLHRKTKCEEKQITGQRWLPRSSAHTTRV